MLSCARLLLHSVLPWQAAGSRLARGLRRTCEVLRLPIMKCIRLVVSALVRAPRAEHRHYGLPRHRAARHSRKRQWNKRVTWLTAHMAYIYQAGRGWHGLDIPGLSAPIIDSLNIYVHCNAKYPPSLSQIRKRRLGICASEQQQQQQRLLPLAIWKLGWAA